MDHVAVAVAEDLDLDVPGPGQVLLQVAVGPPERPVRLPLGRLQSLRRLGGRRHHAHAPAPAPERGFDGHGPADGVPELHHLFGHGQRPVGTGDGPDPGPGGGGPAADLVAHHLYGGGRRPHPAGARLDDGPGEAGVLGQEAVAGVDGVGSAAGDDVEETLDREVALRRRGAPEQVRLIGGPDVAGPPVGLGVHGHRCDAEVPAGPGHPHGDLAPVGDQDLGDGSSPHVGAVCQAGAMPVDSGVLDDDQVRRLAHTRFATFVQLGETTSTNSVLVAEAGRAAARPRGGGRSSIGGPGPFRTPLGVPPRPVAAVLGAAAPQAGGAARAPPPPGHGGAGPGPGRRGAGGDRGRGPPEVAQRHHRLRPGARRGKGRRHPG